MTRLDQEMLEALRVYDRSLARDPQWGQDFFGIDPFYIALGTALSLSLILLRVLERLEPPSSVTS